MINHMYNPHHFTVSQHVTPIHRFLDQAYNASNAARLLVTSLKVTIANKKQKKTPPPLGFNTIGELTFKERGQEINLGYIFHSPAQNLLIITFTGTWTENLWAYNFDYPQVPATTLTNYTDGMLLHRGIYTLYQGIQDQICQVISPFINLNSQIIVTGHSLGGALSNIASLDLARPGAPLGVVNYSFAGPAIGNPQFANAFNALIPGSWRIFNTADIFPSLPFPIINQVLAGQTLDLAKKLIAIDLPGVSSSPLQDTKFIFQQVNNNYAFNLNLGNTWSNHENAYVATIIGADLNLH